MGKELYMQYSDVREIDRGGFGIVTECVDENGNRFAKKTLIATDKKSISRFVNEVRMMSELKHPNIVPVIAKRLSNPPYFYIMPLYESNLRKDLSDFIISSDDDFITNVLRSVLAGLSFAHSEGASHRDIKPENIMRGDNGEYLIGDFGIGKSANYERSQLTTLGTQLGTLNYMAPEQFRNAKDADMKCDIFALGKLILEMHGVEITPGQVGVDDLPVEWRFIIEKCIKINPKDRYQSASELQSDFLDLTRNSNADKTSERIESLLDKQSKSGPSLPTPESNELMKAMETMDNDQLFKAMNKLNRKTINKMDSEKSGSLVRIVKQYCEHVSATGWPFSATDKIGDVLMDIIHSTQNPSIHADCIKGLHEVGFKHNRWHVMGLFGTALNYISKNNIGSVREVIKMYKGGEIQNLKESKAYVNMNEIDKGIKALFRVVPPSKS